MSSHFHDFKQGTGRFGKTAMTLGIVVLMMLVAACGGSSPATTTHNPAVLTIAASPAGDWTENFNPLLANGNGGNLFGTDGLLYEPLQFYNQMQDGKISPLLATGVDLSTDGLKATIHLRSGVKWSDGQNFTADDVVFTINYVIQHNADGVDQNNLKGFVKDASAIDSSTVVVDFSTPSATNLWYLTGVQYIIPQHIWQSVSAPAKYTNPNPVGTGPFTLKSFSPQVYKFKKNPNYWQPGLPKVDEVDYPAFTSNTAATTLLANGSLDWMGLFVPNVQQVYTSHDPQHNIFYSPGIQTTMLELNMTKPLFQDVNVRKAISAALDRANYSKVAEDGYQTVAHPTGLVLPNFQSSLDPSITQTYAGPQPGQSAALLQADGYTRDSNGYFAKNGKELEFTLLAPNGWTDWNQMESLISSDLKAAGIKCDVREPAQADWFTKAGNGDFDAILHWTNHGPSPYYMYNALLNSANSAPIGSNAVSNNERWQDPATDKLLAQYASATDPAAQQQALNGIEQIMVNQVPVIPLLEGSDWNEYTTIRFTGWPSASNPYATPAPFDAPDVEQVVLHLVPTNS